MTATPAAANYNRPAEFDALLVSYSRLLWKFAKQFKRTYEEQEELVQSTQLRALEKWRNYREGGSFTSWLRFLMWQSVTLENGKRKPKEVSDRAAYRKCTEPNQEYAADLALAVSRMRHSVPLQKLAAGYTQGEIRREMGISRSAISQMVIRHREKYLGVVREAG